MGVAMANDDTPAGFLSRWSRRKADVREGRASDEPQLPSVSPLGTPQAAPSPVVKAAPTHGSSHESTDKSAPTLADTQQLTPESDFTGFMARGVTPDVKNAAMKKLFADPHFNVMDGMDIYIDDYSQSEPLPLAMLRQMASAKTLNLFDEDPAHDEKRADKSDDSHISTPKSDDPIDPKELKT